MGKVIMVCIATPIAFAFIWGLTFFTWSVESYVAWKIWQWHVGWSINGITPTLWQLIWANASVSCIFRQFRPSHDDEEGSLAKTLKRFKAMAFWTVSPLLVLALAWLLK